MKFIDAFLDGILKQDDADNKNPDVAEETIVRWMREPQGNFTEHPLAEIVVEAQSENLAREKALFTVGRDLVRNGKVEWGVLYSRAEKIEEGKFRVVLFVIKKQ